jgi:hypothetical protein
MQGNRQQGQLPSCVCLSSQCFLLLGFLDFPDLDRTASARIEAIGPTRLGCVRRPLNSNALQVGPAEVGPL